MKHDFRKIAATVKAERTGSSSFLLLIIVMLISALVYWSAVTEIDKVTRGQGKTISADAHQLVQSAESGVLVKRYVCLLYTCPSPRDQRGSRMPSSA